MITVSVLFEGADTEFFCSFVYASNFETDRKELWEDLKNHQDSSMFRDKPWLIMGDFNETLTVSEHSVPGQTVSLGMRDFQELVRYNSLQDMSYHGPLFTWCNKQEEGLICKKLDRVLMNEAWYDSYQQAYCVFEPGGCSDHLRCRIIIRKDATKTRKPFKFTNVLTKLPDFKNLIETFWGSTEELFVSTSAMYRLSKKLKGLKPAIRQLSKDKLGDLIKRTREAFAVLCDAQSKTLSNASPALVHEEARAYAKWQVLVDLEEKFLSQKAKLHWLWVGDGNNRYYHQAVKLREVWNSIREIQRLNGTIASTQEEIKSEAVNFFRNFLGHQVDDVVDMSEEDLSNLLGFKCSDMDVAALTRTVTDDEIRNVLFAMPANKSPGPDGYTVEFFKASWEILKK